MNRAVAFSMNAVEAPVSSDPQLLNHRLAEHIGHRGAPLANGIVVSIEELQDQTISAAAAVSII